MLIKQPGPTKLNDNIPLKSNYIIKSWVSFLFLVLLVYKNSFPQVNVKKKKSHLSL